MGSAGFYVGQRATVRSNVFIVPVEANRPLGESVVSPLNLATPRTRSTRTRTGLRDLYSSSCCFPGSLTPGTFFMSVRASFHAR